MFDIIKKVFFVIIDFPNQKHARLYIFWMMIYFAALFLLYNYIHVADYECEEMWFLLC